MEQSFYVTSTLEKDHPNYAAAMERAQRVNEIAFEEGGVKSLSSMTELLSQAVDRDDISSLKLNAFSKDIEAVKQNTVELDDSRDPAISRGGPQEQQSKLGVDKDESFLGWLKLQMKSADWGNYVRGSEEFLGIDRDLERLGKANPEVAREMWKENTPPGMALPFYLTPEFEKGSTRAHGPDLAKAPAADRASPGATQKGLAEPEMAQAFKVPEEIKRRYLATDSKFYFRDEKNKLAFEDRGRKLVTEHNDPDVAKSLVDMASAKGWGKIKVAGHDEFKREVWLQATLKGIEVAGYKPKDVDLAKLHEMQSSRAKNSVEQDTQRDVAGPSTAKGKAVPDEERAYSVPGQNKADNFKGKLLEHGRANYDFDDKKDLSYFVKLETPNGTKMHWGVDLGRAVDEVGAKVGEMIEVERLGMRPVTVQEKQFDSDGKFTGVKEVSAERVEWRVTGPEKEKALDAATSAQKAKEAAPEKPVAAPKVEKERAAKTVEKPVEQKLNPAKDVASKSPAKLKGDYLVPVAVISEVLKEKGYSEKTIARVQSEATRRLGIMAEKGEPAPGVKVYDRTASRERPREKIVSKTKDHQQERSR